jgi:hypothetical protein
MRISPLLLCASMVIANGCSDSTAPHPFAAFSDAFDGSAIDSTHWSYGGNVTVGGGVLTLNREFTDDYVESRNTYSGDWIVTLDIRLDSIGWNDMFHGISIRDAGGQGVSLGFSEYGKLYMAQHDSVQGGFSTSFSYGPAGSNRTGQWMRWTIENSGGTVTVLVDSQPVTGLPTGHVPDGVQISLPGYYEDGDGGAHVGVTTSEVTFFSIAPQ